MRNRLIPLAAAALWWLPSGTVCAQDPAQNGAQNSPKTSAQGAPQKPQPQATSDSGSGDQPISLADMARAARAKKQSDAKPAPKTSKVLDDDNMPRGFYAADTTTANADPPGSATPASQGSGLFSEFRGKVVLLDFWASWCGPCRSALPNLKRLQAVYGGGDFVVVSISEDDDESAWRAFVASHNMTWPQRLDSDGSIQHQFGVNALPTYVLLGRDGSVVQKFVGEELAESIVERIGPDLKKTLAAKP